jgi:hypothetical protein
MLDPWIRKPFCQHCQDIFYIIDAAGNQVPCPSCSCPVCCRLTYTHPDLGGCTCCEPNQKAATLEQPRPSVERIFFQS